MSIIKTFVTLYGKDKSDKVRVWDCKVVDEKTSATIHITHGTIDGKSTTSVREIKSGKNIGKKNETSIQEQAIKEAEKSWKDKIEKEGYCESLDILSNNKPTTFDPMLAEKYDPNSKVNRKVDIVFPCYTQPKLDGIRCLTYSLADKKIVNQSRKLKPFFHLDHINNEVAQILHQERIVLDGELYNHTISFNQIAGIVKKEKCSEADRKALLQIEYHIYDAFIPGQPEPFEKRWERLEQLFKNKKLAYCKLVKTEICTLAEDLIDMHSDVISEGYEGIMLRNKNGIYEHNRSRHLQKYKTFMDDEFKVVGYHEGSGNDAGCVVWTCEAKNGKHFDVRPQGSVESRQEWFQQAKKYIGKQLTVKYQELSEYGIPRFPVGLAFRDYE